MYRCYLVLTLYKLMKTDENSSGHCWHKASSRVEKVRVLMITLACGISISVWYNLKNSFSKQFIYNFDYFIERKFIRLLNYFEQTNSYNHIQPRYTQCISSSPIYAKLCFIEQLFPQIPTEIRLKPQRNRNSLFDERLSFDLPNILDFLVI